MKSYLTFFASYSEASLIPGLKQQIRDYLGKRMIENECEDSPALILNQELSEEDYKEISSMVEKLNSQTVSVFLVETSNATLINKYIIPLNIKENTSKG